MRSQLRPALVSLALLTLLTGIIYPLAVTAMAAVAFPRKAAGSLIVHDGRTLGSDLIGQNFDDAKYFWGRLSATAPVPYNAASSGASNLGTTNPALSDQASARIKALREADPSNVAPIPMDLVTASGSGLDPHISPAAAEYQVKRVARARGMDERRVREVVARYTQGRQLGILGEERVNVLMLNLALDREAGH